MKMLLALLTGSAIITDCARGRIYNALVFPALVLGILTRVLAKDFAAASLAVLLLEIFAPFFLLFPFWLLTSRGICAGDIKLLMAVAACTPPRVFGRLTAAAFIAAAAMSVLQLIQSRGKKKSIPFAVPVGFAAVLYLGGVL